MSQQFEPANPILNIQTFGTQSPIYMGDYDSQPAIVMPTDKDEFLQESTPIQDLANAPVKKERKPLSYFASDEYINHLISDEKQDALWSEITADTSSGQFPPLSKLGGVLIESMDPTYKIRGDGLQPPSRSVFDIFGLWTEEHRTKYLHSVGNVGKVELVIDPDHIGNPYFSGIFHGAGYGLIRLSSAQAPTLNQATKPLTPGMGLKFLRSGMDSANLVSMFSVHGQPGDWNFFSNDFSTHVDTASGNLELEILTKKFSTETQYVQVSALSDMAQYDSAGFKMEEVDIPFSLRFEPHDDVKSLFPKTAPEDPMEYVKQLSSIPANSTLYNVYGMSDPKEIGGKELYIGTLKLDGQLTTSLWGDEKLFFKHQKADDDLVFRPDWEPYMPKLQEGARCPFLENLLS